MVAVVVSHDRRDLLAEVLSAVREQDRPVDHVLVVDNASTDGTVEMLRERHPDVVVRALAQNGGGAGGFALGVRLALDDGADLVWLLDDDAVPSTSALRALLEARDRYPGGTRPAALASKVVWTDGRLHRMNIPRRRRGASAAERGRAAAVGCTPMRTASFCSLLVDGDVARREALPVADYFLWNDDLEYTARLLRRRVGLVCPASVVVHKTATFYNSGSAPGDRLFFDVRNMVWMLLRSPAMSPVERGVFAAVTVRRWARTTYRSRERRRVLLTLARGVAAGIVRAPRPTARVVDELSSSEV